MIDMIDRYIDRVCKYIYTTEYYSGTKRKEMLSFATTRMDHDGIMLSDVSRQRKTDTV